jgi:electron transfer flavoprotein-quinone oxidoreductase
VLSERVQGRYPALICDLVESLFTVTNPTPKPGGLRLTVNAARRNGVKLRELAADTLRAARTFG